MLRFEPDAFVPDGPPEEDQRLAIEFSTGMCQFIQLLALADVDASDLIQTFSPPLLLYGRQSAYPPHHYPDDNADE